MARVAGAVVGLASAASFHFVVADQYLPVDVLYPNRVAFSFQLEFHKFKFLIFSHFFGQE